MSDIDDESTVVQLMLRWELERKAGREVTIVDLCRDRPDLVEEVRRGVEVLRLMDTPPSTSLGTVEWNECSGPRTMAGGPGRESLLGDGRYEVLGEIARGGMGVVLRAFDRTIDREIALKVLHPEGQGDPDRVRRFIAEARLTGQLQHPGIPPVHDQGALPDGRAYFAMKLVMGRTLADLLAERGDPTTDLTRFLTIFEAACQAVAYAHDKRVIHRDLKPLNIMLGAFGEVQVMDWGLAKILDGERGSTSTPGDLVRAANDDPLGPHSRAGAVMGTLAYMSPEQANGEVALVDERSDVFALGSILCLILTGQPAYGGATREGLHLKAMRGDVGEPMDRLRACGADVDLIDLARDCLAHDPADRPTNAGVVATRMAAYREAVQDRLHAAELARVAAEAAAREERKRRVWQLGFAMAALVLLALGGWALVWRQQSVRRVSDLLGRADGLCLEAARDPRGGDLGPARAALAQAKEALEAVPWSDLHKQFARIEARLTEVAKARTLVKDLQETRAGREERSADQETTGDPDRVRWDLAHWDWDRADREYAMSFRRFGLDLKTMDPGEAGARLVRLGAAVEEVAAALDSWAWDRIRAGKDTPAGLTERLIEVARAGDPDPWRNLLRSRFGRPEAEVRGVCIDLAVDERACEKQPPVWLSLLAKILRSLGESDRSAGVLRTGWLRHPGDYWLSYELGLLSWDEQVGRYRHPEEAVRFLTVAVSLSPESATTRVSLGNALNSHGRRDEAMAQFREANRIRPDMPDGHFNLADVYFAEGQYEEAIVECRLAVQLQPDRAGSWNNLGNAQSMSGQLDEALDSYRKAIRLQPDYALAHYNLGNTLKLKGRLEDALASYLEAVRLRPDMPELRLNLGVTLYRLEKVDEAIAEWRAATQARPDAGAYSNLAVAYHSQGRVDEAIAALRETVRLKPGDALAHSNLGVLLLQQGKLDEARDMFRKAAGLAQAETPLALSLAATVREVERRIDLRDRFAEILAGTSQPRGPTEGVIFAQMAHDRGHYGTAYRLWQAALSESPDLGEDRKFPYRYDAACSAILAATGGGHDRQRSDESARRELRRQALEWLRREVAAWKALVKSGEDEGRSRAVRALEFWLKDEDLASVRDEDALRVMDEAERTNWYELWAEVRDQIAEGRKD
jgi:serine/threonine-protein kinase